jgi:hypothetical protein
LLHGRQLSIFDYVVVNVHLIQSPLHCGDHHDQRFFHIPFPRAQEPQEERIGVIMLYHAPERTAQLLWRYVCYGGLELCGLTEFVVFCG